MNATRAKMLYPFEQRWSPRSSSDNERLLWRPTVGRINCWMVRSMLCSLAARLNRHTVVFLIFHPERSLRPRFTWWGFELFTVWPHSVVSERIFVRIGCQPANANVCMCEPRYSLSCNSYGFVKLHCNDDSRTRFPVGRLICMAIHFKWLSIHFVWMFSPAHTETLLVRMSKTIAPVCALPLNGIILFGEWIHCRWIRIHW